MKTNTIKISELIRGELRSRIEAKKIYERAKSITDCNISIDFGDVCFMSRSFADELCNVLDKLKEDGKNVNIENQCEDIKLILEIVQANRNKPKTINENGEIKQFSDMDALSNFMSNI